MKLELKHLAPYLPYGLKMKTPNGVFELDDIKTKSPWKLWVTRDNKSNKKVIDSMNCSGRGFTLKEVKLILRPLRDLKNGFNGMFIYKEKEINRLTKLEDINNSTFSMNSQLKNFNYLFENHFDVFGLIEKGLAISYNDLNQ